MSEQNINNITPNIEDEISSKLSGDMQKNALDFVAYLRALGMTNHATYSSAFEYGGKWACILVILDDDWMICDNPLTKHYDDFPVDIKLKEFALAHVKKCDMCGGGAVDGCGHEDQGANKMIFGKYHENLCSSEVHFFNPDTEALENLKILMQLWKQDLEA